MPSLNFKKGVPIGRIYGGHLDGKYIYLSMDDSSSKFSQDDANDQIETQIYDIISYDHDNRRTIRENDLLRLERAISNERPRGLDDRLMKIYNKAIKAREMRSGKEIYLDDGTIQPIPIVNKAEPDQTEVGYIAGPSGSGKSVYIAKWILEYHKLFPCSPIYLFSRKRSDATIDAIADDIRLTRILLDKSFLKDNNAAGTEMPKQSFEEYSDEDESASEDGDNISIDSEAEIDYQEETLGNDYLAIYKNSLCIFDDIDTIQDKLIMEKVKKLRDDLLETGRSSGIYVLSTSHMLCNYRNTRQNLNEASFVTIFPAFGNKYQMREYLKRYQGMDKTQIQRIMSLPTRWATIYCRAPQYVMYESGVYLL